MKLVTVWESQTQYWGNTKDDPESKLRSGRSFMFYVHHARAAAASPGGPPIERHVLEYNGIYYMLAKPWNGEVHSFPPAGTELRSIPVFIAEKSDDISCLAHDEEMRRVCVGSAGTLVVDPVL